MMVIGGEGRLSGLMADRVQDDMLSLLIPREAADLCFPWEISIPMKNVVRNLHKILPERVRAFYPAIDALNHPRSLLIRGRHNGFLLAMPSPSNLKNLSITLQTGKGITVASTPAPTPEKASAPQLTRNWMTRSEVAAEIGKSTDTVDNYCRDGVLRFTKAGRQVRITKESVQHYLDGRS